MRIDFWLISLTLCLGTFGVEASVGEEKEFNVYPEIVYPETRQGEQVDDYHGTKVADPFRWLEDDNSEETKAWVQAQNSFTESYLEALPSRQKFVDRLTAIWNFERFGRPYEKGGRYFYERNDGLQNQSVLYVSEGLEGEPRVLLDPNEWSKEGVVDLASWQPSKNGKLLAFSISTGGSDWKEWKVLDVDTGKELEDHLRWVKFSGVSWTPDHAGFYYSRYDEPATGAELTAANYFQKLYYHKIGDAQEKDRLVYERPDEKEWGFGGEVTDDGAYLIVEVWRGTERKNQLFYRSLETDSEFVELITGFDAQYSFIGNNGSLFWIQTDDDAARKRLIGIDVTKPNRDQWVEIIPESEDSLQSVSVVGEQFFARYLHDAHTVVKRFDLTGKPLGEAELPGIGTAYGFGGERDAKETFFSFSNYTTPSSIYRYDIATNKATVFRKPDVDFDGDAFETKQVFVPSKDGTKIPLFITHKKGIPLDGTNPTMLYGYGGFDISLTPGFSVSTAVWLEMGGVYVVANLRGGGEYGRQWHESGMKEKKQNVFDDFISSAKWLAANGYADAEHLAIRGGSNGGLLVGAVMTQEPNLFAAAAPAVGVMDMLRYHKFTIGWAWVSEYGSADEKDDFPNLLKYSPLHNLKAGVKYPATLVTTGDHDDRVVPAHSFKFAAELQKSQAKDGPPTLIRIETSGGHGAGKPISKVIQESADVSAFLWEAVNSK